MEILLLLVELRKNKVFSSKSQTPGVGNLPVLGNLFKGKSQIR